MIRAAADGSEADLRARLAQGYGEDSMVELALAIATARVFPTAKRALGYATSCSLVRIEI